MENDKEMGD